MVSIDDRLIGTSELAADVGEVIGTLSSDVLKFQQASIKT